MADWREHNPSNRQGTCLWCGRELHRKPKFKAVTRDGGGTDFVQDGYHEKRGAYQDDFFCNLRCGFQFGVAQAGFGKRINPREVHL